jgi:hypothetical protein
MPGKHQAGCRFFLVTSLLDAQKRSNSSSEGGRKLFAMKPQQRNRSIARKAGSYKSIEASARSADYSFLIACPPNSLRSDDNSLSAKESSSRERKRSISDSVITGAETLSSSAASTVQRPSPESTT